MDRHARRRHATRSRSGTFENMSFAENLGCGTLGDGFIGLGDPNSLGNGALFADPDHAGARADRPGCWGWAWPRSARARGAPAAPPDQPIASASQTSSSTAASSGGSLPAASSVARCTPRRRKYSSSSRASTSAASAAASALGAPHPALVPAGAQARDQELGQLQRLLHRQQVGAAGDGRHVGLGGGEHVAQRPPAGPARRPAPSPTFCGACALAACVTRPIQCWSNSPGTARSATLARSSVSYGLRTALSVASVTASRRPSGEKRSASMRVRIARAVHALVVFGDGARHRRRVVGQLRDQQRAHVRVHDQLLVADEVERAVGVGLAVRRRDVHLAQVVQSGRTASRAGSRRRRRRWPPSARR